MSQLAATSDNILKVAGRWVTEREYAALHSLHPATLCNWRFRDRKAGRTEAAPGFPAYRRFGKAVRYWLASDERGGEAA